MQCYFVNMRRWVPAYNIADCNCKWKFVLIVRVQYLKLIRICDTYNSSDLMP